MWRAISIRSKLVVRIALRNTIYRACIVAFPYAIISNRNFYSNWKYKHLDEYININSDAMGQARYRANDLLLKTTFRRWTSTTIRIRLSENHKNCEY